eukprot:scaffold24023_cov32-Attheya_sp.AAC.2
MATSHRHAAANGANSDQLPNDDIIQTNSASVHIDTGVDSTSVRDDQKWWQSDQEGISLLATAAGAAGELPYFHDEDALSSNHTTHTMTPDHPEPILQPNNPLARAVGVNDTNDVLGMELSILPSSPRHGRSHTVNVV